ncbi:MAG: hypothetical protein AAGB46_08200 [Verrucomicrobiota bacterium]
MTRLHTLGLLLIAFQLAAFVYAKVVDSRYFCWAPFDMHTSYQMEVVIDGRALTPQQIKTRYHLDHKGGNPRSYVEILGPIQQYEETYGKTDGAQITVRYSVNGKPEQIWEYPPKS